MIPFAALLERLAFTPQRNGKLRLLQAYLTETPDPDRGYGLGALTSGLTFPHAKPALIHDLVARRVDPDLFRLSYDYVGDLAETAALIWPARPTSEPAPGLASVVSTLQQAGKDALPDLLEGWLDRLDAGGRYALLKLITGAMRVGLSARLTKSALAAMGPVPLAHIEELWHGFAPPYTELFAWLEGHAPLPPAGPAPGFRPLMLANALDDGDLVHLDPAHYAAEWKWDGARVQLAGQGGEARIFTRSGEDISRSFPDVLRAVGFDGVLDGELLIVRDGRVAPFNDLQQRLGRKAVSRAMLEERPAHVRLYDMLFRGADDLRGLAFADRRRHLEDWFDRRRPDRMDLSPLIPFTSWADLGQLRALARAGDTEGVMLKRWDSTYVAGRPKGPWFKWKRDPLSVDCVLMYAQRGHGKRSSYYSDFTFGCWTETAQGKRQLVPVGKAYFGFTDAELGELDRWVRTHTVDRFGPVRAVAPELVLEIAFDGVQRSSRHKSGVAMRFPRVRRIRWDKPAADADSLPTLTRMIDGGVSRAPTLGDPQG